MRQPEKFGVAFLPSVMFVTVVNVAFGVYAAVALLTAEWASYHRRKTV